MKGKSALLLAAAFLLAAGSSCSPSGQKSQAGTVFSAPPELAPVVAGGDTLSGFVTTSGAWAKHKTVVTTAYDEKNLLLRFVCSTERGKKLLYGGKIKDDMGLFGGENVEIFLCTQPETGKYYQLALNPDGVMYSALGRDISWDPEGAKVKTVRKDDSWTLDISIPFKSLGYAAAPKEGTIWKVNFCRCYHVEGLREVSNLAGISSYHDCSQYREMIFAKKGTKSRILLEDFQYSPGKIKASFSLQRVNEPVTVEIRKGESSHRTSNLPSSGTFSVTAELPPSYVPLKDLDPVYISAKNSIDHKSILSARLNVTGDSRDMILPNKFYYKAGKDKKVSFVLSHPREDGDIAMKVTLSDREGKVLRKDVFTGKGSFDIADLKEGAYILSASCAGGHSTRLLFIRSAEKLAGVPLKKGALLALKDGAVTSGGNFVYLISASSTGKPLPEKKFFNFRAGNFGNMPNSAQIAGTPGKRLLRNPKTAYFYAGGKDAYYAAMEKHFSKANPASPTFHRFTYEAQIPTFLPGKNSQKYEEVDSGAFHRDLYKFLKKKFPALLFCLQTDAPDHVKDFVDACDLMEVCPPGGYSDAAIERLKYGLPRVVKALKGKPVLFWMGVTIPNNSCRRAEELRAAIYLHIIHGGSGTIMHMGHGRLPDQRTRLWSVIKGINGEVASFYPKYRSMPLLDGKFLKLHGEKEFSFSVRGNDREAIALVVSLSSGENRMMLNPADGWKIVSGARAGKWENWTPYEARSIHLKK